MNDTLKEKIRSTSFYVYSQALKELKPDDCPNIDEIDLVVLMRILYWYTEAAGFQDIYDLSVQVYTIFKKYRENGTINTDSCFAKIMLFIVEFADNGNYASETLSTRVAFNMTVDQISHIASSEENAVLEKYGALLDDMYSTTSDCYYNVMRELIEERHFDFIFPFVKTLAPEHQGWVLHSLNKFTNNKNVISLYNEIQKSTPSNGLKEEIDDYLKQINN
jgi:hypothetical protein